MSFKEREIGESGFIEMETKFSTFFVPGNLYMSQASYEPLIRPTILKTTTIMTVIIISVFSLPCRCHRAFLNIVPFFSNHSVLAWRSYCCIHGWSYKWTFFNLPAFFLRFKPNVLSLPVRSFIPAIQLPFCVLKMLEIFPSTLLSCVHSHMIVETETSSD